MKQVSVIISTYTADVSGVCSALYELGGMVVIHDPSGCNSTYNTHDEPRWYEQDSLVFISGLSEIDAIMGNDEKFIRDIVRAAQELNPRFIALVRTPVPMMIGTDFEAIRLLIEEETGIPTFYFATNGMHSYIQGVERALETVAEQLMAPKLQGQRVSKEAVIPINLLGVTPLDFSVNSTLDSMIHFFENRGCPVISSVAMKSTPEAIQNAGNAQVNVVVSSAGLLAAKAMEERFHIPYVAGIPTDVFGDFLVEAIREAAKTGQNNLNTIKLSEPSVKKVRQKEEGIYIIGEAVISQSLKMAISLKYGYAVRVICPLETRKELLAEDCVLLQSEEDIREALQSAKAVIADPMYQPICPESAVFFPLPHEAFSGRIYRKQIPDLTNLTFLQPWIESLSF